MSEMPGAAVLAMVERGEIPGAVRATLRMPRQGVRPVELLGILNAAINRDEPALVDAAATLAMNADILPRVRAQLGWRLAVAGFGTQAMAVLLCDPAVLTDPGALQQAMVALRLVIQRAAPGTLTHSQATALARRLLPRDGADAPLSPFGFAPLPQDAPMALGRPAVLHVAADVPASIRDEAEPVLGDFGDRMAAARPPSVRMLEDVFVNRLGQIWGRDGRVFEHRTRAIPPASRAAEASASVIEDAVLGVEPHNNMYHWLAEWLPSLAWRLEDAGSAVTVLVRDGAAPFVAESIELGAAGPVAVAEAGDAVLVRRLHIGDRGLVMLPRNAEARRVFARMAARATATVPVPAGGWPPLYMSRRDSRNRVMTNEPLLEAALAERGFAVATMSGRHFAEQVAMVSGAGRLVSPHGAGLALLVAATPGLRVLELVPGFRGAMTLRLNMARISHAVGHEHHVWLQAPSVGGSAWAADLDPVLGLVDTVLGGST